MSIDLEAIEARVNEVKGKRLFLGAMETQALADRKALLAEVKRLHGELDAQNEGLKNLIETSIPELETEVEGIDQNLQA